MAVKARRHIHKYARVKSPDGFVWRCMTPTCSHYMPQHQEYLLDGRASICWMCDKPTVILNLETEKRDKPICHDCDPVMSKLKQVFAEPEEQSNRDFYLEQLKIPKDYPAPTKTVAATTSDIEATPETDDVEVFNPTPETEVEEKEFDYHSASPKEQLVRINKLIEMGKL